MLIDIQGVSKVFRTSDVETHALSNVNLGIEEGEYVAIEGPSGCGKSTLLAILGLLDTPTSGEYTLLGEGTRTLSNANRSRVRNRHVGIIFQNFNLIGDLTVAENVELPLKYGGMVPKDRRTRVRSLLEQVGMDHRAKHYPAMLSGGQQQRVAVARAAVTSPSLLLADEPTGNLDSVNGNAVMDLIADLHRRGSTIVMVSHDPRFNKYADRTIGLLDGSIVSPAIAARM